MLEAKWEANPRTLREELDERVVRDPRFHPRDAAQRAGRAAAERARRRADDDDDDDAIGPPGGTGVGRRWFRPVWALSR